MIPAGWLGSLGLLLALATLAGAEQRDDGPAPAGELHLSSCDEVVRLDLTFRCCVERTVTSEEFANGPYILQVAIEQEGRQLAGGEFPLAKLGQLRDGVQIALIPSANEPSEAQAELHLTLTNPQRSVIQRLDRRLATPRGLQRSLERSYRRLLEADRERREPLPFLWAEQAGELMADGPSLRTCALLVDLDGRLNRWLAGERPPPASGGGSTLAIEDPVDGSVQPYRLHLPILLGGSVPVALVLSHRGDAPRKSAWPELPAAWLKAAREAGVAVVEAYPAGDLGWGGAARRRALLALAAAQRACPALDSEAVAVVGTGDGANGAIALAEGEPLRWTALALVDPELEAAPAGDGGAVDRWLAMHAAGARPAQLVGLQVLMCGTANPACRAWQQRLERAGGELVSGTPPADDPAFWRALAAAVKGRPQREYVVLAPGRYGPVAVEQLDRWGEIADLRVESAAPLRVATVGIARLDAESSAAWSSDGKPQRPHPAALPAPAKVAGQAQGPLAAYADGPFVVVVGTGEHAAAAADNRQLAQAFLAAWGVHAQGRPPQVDDTAFRDQDFPRQHLVLIGNTRSNLLLKRLVGDDPGFPLAWDGRSVSCRGASFLRNQRRAVAVAWPHPAHDGRLLVVLDGGPAWQLRGRYSGPPLAGLPDLVIGGAEAEDPPAEWLLFDNRWR